MDRLPKSVQKTLQLPHNQPPKASRHKVAGEGTRHRGPHPCRPAQRLHDAHETTAPLGMTLIRMPNHRLPKDLLFGELQGGKRSCGTPKKRCKDSLKASLMTFTIDHDSWKAEAQGRCGWRAAVFEGAKRCEASRTLCSRAAQAGKRR